MKDQPFALLIDVRRVTTATEVGRSGTSWSENVRTARIMYNQRLYLVAIHSVVRWFASRRSCYAAHYGNEGEQIACEFGMGRHVWLPA